MTGKGGRPCVFLCHPCACEDPASLSFVVVLAPAGGAVPRSRPFSWRRGLSERSEFRSPHTRDRGTGTPLGATPGREWFWVLLPKQKDLVVRGRNPAILLPSSCGADTPQEKRKEGRAPRPAPTHRHHEPVGDDLQPALSGAEGCRPASFQITTPPQTLDPRSGSGMTAGGSGLVLDIFNRGSGMTERDNESCQRLS